MDHWYSIAISGHHQHVDKLLISWFEGTNHFISLPMTWKKDDPITHAKGVQSWCSCQWLMAIDDMHARNQIDEWFIYIDGITFDLNERNSSTNTFCQAFTSSQQEHIYVMTVHTLSDTRKQSVLKQMKAFLVECKCKCKVLLHVSSWHSPAVTLMLWLLVTIHVII